MLATWESLARELGVRDRAHFVGWLSQEECAARLRSAVALVYPVSTNAGAP